jgi:hypothetical protein
VGGWSVGRRAALAQPGPRRWWAEQSFPAHAAAPAGGLLGRAPTPLPGAPRTRAAAPTPQECKYELTPADSLLSYLPLAHIFDRCAAALGSARPSAAAAAPTAPLLARGHHLAFATAPP